MAHAPSDPAYLLQPSRSPNGLETSPLHEARLWHFYDPDELYLGWRVQPLGKFRFRTGNQQNRRTVASSNPVRVPAVESSVVTGTMGIKEGHCWIVGERFVEEVGTSHLQ